jgi:nitrate reductase gamma subunit
VEDEMEALIDWARGPAFAFALAFMLAGLVRHWAITVWEMRKTMRRAGDKSLAYGPALKATLRWLFPLGKLRHQFLFTLSSLLFHVAILIVPLFLAGHIVLWARGIGLSWPAIPNSLADVLTVTAVVTGVALVVQRLAARATRALSRFQDYALPLLIALPFATGFLIVHPGLNPFSFSATLLVHIMSANLILVLIPITKLTHAVLMPSAQVVSEMGWRWPADAGSRVGIALGKQDEPI